MRGMRRDRLLWIAAILLPLAALGQTSVCLTTFAPSPPFVPPAPYDLKHVPFGMFAYGTDELWTNVGVDGVWRLTHNADKSGGSVTKVLFWTKDFNWRQELKPELTVTARRMDGDSPAVVVKDAHAVFITGNTPAMMTGIRIPTAGCWEVTGSYRSLSVTFTVSVQP
jgi:hypothetical protein